MTTTPQPTGLDKVRASMMTGAMLVMGACVFGGLTAVVLMALGQRTGAGAVAIVAGVVIIAGVVIQISAAKKLKAGQKSDQKSGQGGKP